MFPEGTTGDSAMPPSSKVHCCQNGRSGSRESTQSITRYVRPEAAIADASAKTPTIVIRSGDAKPPSATEAGARPTKSTATIATMGGTNSSTIAKIHITITTVRIAANIADCEGSPSAPPARNAATGSTVAHTQPVAASFVSGFAAGFDARAAPREMDSPPSIDASEIVAAAETGGHCDRTSSSASRGTRHATTAVRAVTAHAYSAIPAAASAPQCPDSIARSRPAGVTSTASPSAST